MVVRHVLTVLIALGLCAPGSLALAACKIGKIAELPVTMTALKPMIAARINGADALFVADSGAFYSVITPASAAAYKLETRPAPGNITLAGIGGTTEAAITTVKEFTLANIPLAYVDFIVGGNDPGHGAIGFLGQNVLATGDTEYDLANGVIRLMRPNGCERASMAYWLEPSQPYSVIDIHTAQRSAPHTTGAAFINGKKIRVLFDTGANISLITLRAAARAGVTPHTSGVEDAGYSRGIGRAAVKTWSAPFASFRIGAEEVKNAQLRIADVHMDNADMLLGTDFFLSHRIYVANDQRKLYFTSNSTNEPTDAAGFARRGAASTARHEYQDAIADLTRASALDPGEPQYLHDRGIAHLGNQQPGLALADFDAALELKPGHVAARVARAELRLAQGDDDAAVADLDAADSNAAKEADIRLLMGNLYARAGIYERAAVQFTQWLMTHPQDARKADVLNGRCRARAMWGQQLDAALEDCNAALKLRPDTAHFLDTRGLVRLRLDQLDRSIADYDAALKLEPRNAWSLYGRGLSRLRQGMTAEGRADIDAALAVQPMIADEARKRGVAP